MSFEKWRDNAVPLDELMRAVTLAMSQSNYRREPLPGDRQDRHFEAWFDGGAMVMETGGSTYYYLDNGIEVVTPGIVPVRSPQRLRLSVSWPDGRAVRIEQCADRVDSEMDEEPTRDVQAEEQPRFPWGKPEQWFCTRCGGGPMPSSDTACMSCHEPRVVDNEFLTHGQCSKCQHWNAVVASYCQWCGVNQKV